MSKLTVLGHVACMNAMKSIYRVLVGISEGKRKLGRPRCSLEDIRKVLRK
jgi:hypothetical protein